MKALVIDDDREQMYHYSKILSKAGFDVEKAMLAEDGFQRYQRAQPDLVVTDYQIGDDNGVLLAGRIREYERQAGIRARIVLMSSDWPNINLAEADIDAFYYKQDPVEELYAAIGDKMPKNKP